MLCPGVHVQVGVSLYLGYFYSSLLFRITSIELKTSRLRYEPLPCDHLEGGSSS